jgi:hypothetical protein
MSTMTESRQRAIDGITYTELAQAKGPDFEHGLMLLTITDAGEKMAVCVCAAVGFGDTDDAAKDALREAHEFAAEIRARYEQP